MRLHIMSDIHLEFGLLRFKNITSDVIILAGDIGTGMIAFNWIEVFLPKTKPIIYLPGNHEFYGKNINDQRALLRERADRSTHNIHFLDDDYTTIDGQFFVGGTLWTDFNLYGNATKAAVEANFGMNDFRLIEGMSIQKWMDMHRATRKFFEEHITPETVVVSHMGPNIGSVHEMYGKSPLNAAYSSDILNEIPTKPKLWIHGHTHHSHDYSVGNTRVVCNPRGYVGHEINSNFDPKFIIEI